LDRPWGTGKIPKIKEPEKKKKEVGGEGISGPNIQIYFIKVKPKTIIEKTRGGNFFYTGEKRAVSGAVFSFFF